MDYNQIYFQSIYLAAQAITTTTVNRINDGDTILIYGRFDFSLTSLSYVKRRQF